jgi:hypothetical protein
MPPVACACRRSSEPRHEWRVHRSRAWHRPLTRPLAALPAAAAPAASQLADDQTLQLDRSLPVRPKGVQLRSLLEPHGGLPRFAAAIRNGGSAASPLRVCYLGGSVTEQKAGWRPLVTAWIESQLAAGGGGRGTGTGGSGLVQEIPAWCGNSGSKVRDWQAIGIAIPSRFRPAHARTHTQTPSPLPPIPHPIPTPTRCSPSWPMNGSSPARPTCYS